MSEEKPRLSRREMRERGLLKPVEDNAPVEGTRRLLTETQELRLGRPSRQQLREREKHSHHQEMSERPATPSASSLPVPAASETAAGPDQAVALTPDSAASSDIAAEPELAEVAEPHDLAGSEKATPRTGTAPSADSAAGSQSERRSVFDRFDAAPLVEDGTRVTTRDTNDEVPVNNSSADHASLEDKLLARMRNDAGASWPGTSSPTEDAGSSLAGSVADPVPAAPPRAAPPRTSQSAPSRTPIAERGFLDADDDDDIPDEKPRGGLMLVLGIIAGAVIGVLIGIWLKNAFFSSGIVDISTLRATVASINPPTFFQEMHL